ncbi:hypothetical protein [Novosphingobium malaysiense]|uniref:Uncharacterized protein n=1 Tax=Novosphingobium malaysiense TaxID=1348853 RepID=A0A0B1ZUR7_9SPHN|nr:hypothetical protein [Novosphingobium malaysiense]KHK92877.1 hypothetical protein LK12_00200 [Novosphingobium malaysiense]
MELTFIGAIQLAIGLAIVVAGSVRSAFAFLMISGLFDGSAAVLLPALGGTSIPPIQFAILFVYLRIVAPRGGFLGFLAEAISANRLAVLYVVYGVASAFVAPKIFAGMMDVAPMRMTGEGGLFNTVPLVPTSQNITASVYMIGFLLIALASYVVCRHRGGVAVLVNTAIVVGWTHVILGVAVALAKGTPLDGYFELMRNGNYAQLDQSYQGFIRIRGLFPESSSFADFGFTWFLLNAELWYRSVRSRATGWAALALAAVLFFSTSSTAYVGLAGYILFFTLRALFLPASVHAPKLRQIGIVMLILAVAVAGTMVLVPQFSAAVSDMVFGMTVGKSDSLSGQQRLFWALQGWEAFKTSYGVGIGPGSFRSSSLFAAILGATGVFGVALFIGYLVEVLKPMRASTFSHSDNLAWNIGGALSVAAILSLIPAAVGSPKSDPGGNFAILAGAALALRPSRRQRGQTGNVASGIVARLTGRGETVPGSSGAAGTI